MQSASSTHNASTASAPTCRWSRGLDEVLECCDEVRCGKLVGLPFAGCFSAEKRAGEKFQLASSQWQARWQLGAGNHPQQSTAVTLEHD